MLHAAFPSPAPVRCRGSHCPSLPSEGTPTVPRQPPAPNSPDFLFFFFSFSFLSSKQRAETKIPRKAQAQQSRGCSQPGGFGGGEGCSRFPAALPRSRSGAASPAHSCAVSQGSEKPGGFKNNPGAAGMLRSPPTTAPAPRTGPKFGQNPRGQHRPPGWGSSAQVEAKPSSETASVVKCQVPYKPGDS